MIVRAQAPLMPGARLTPAAHAGPRRGLHLVRGGVNYRRRGLGAADTSGTVAGIVSSYANSFTYGLPSNVEHNMASTPDVVAETLASAARNFCADAVPGTPCDPNSVNTQIAQAVANYTAAYNAQVAKTAAQVSSGQIGVPMGYAYPPDYQQPVAAPPPPLAPPPPPAPAPVVVAPVVSTPVQSNAPAAAVAPVPTSSPAAPAVQSNAPTPSMVIPGIASASSFLTESAFLGIPNWALGAGAIAVGFALFGGNRR